MSFVYQRLPSAAMPARRMPDGGDLHITVIVAIAFPEEFTAVTVMTLEPFARGRLAAVQLVPFSAHVPVLVLAAFAQVILAVFESVPARVTVVLVVVYAPTAVGIGLPIVTLGRALNVTSTV